MVGPLFLNRHKTARLTYSVAARQVTRLAARAGIPDAERVSPHPLRHAFVTVLLANKVPIEQVQDAVGHKDARTTRRYDRRSQSLDEHPTYLMATFMAKQRNGQ